MSGESGQETRDCAVCLQKCHYPTQLPCGHVFCFLCVKGVAIQNKKCAMCRAEIPFDYLDHPVILKKVQPENTSLQPAEGFQWYYEGRNGWWKYDERSNIELETAFNAGDGECKLLLAGALYIIDFQGMLQVQCRDPTRRRRVRRDTPTLPAKGVAGIKIDAPDNSTRLQIKTENEEGQNISNHDTSTDSEVEIIEIEDEVVEIMDDEESQGNNELSTGNNSFGEVLQRLSSMDLQGHIGNEVTREFSTTEDTH